MAGGMASTPKANGAGSPNLTLPLSENQLQFLSNGAQPDVVAVSDKQDSRSPSMGSHSNLSQSQLRTVSSSSSLHSTASARKDFDLSQAPGAFTHQRPHQQPPALSEVSAPLPIQQPVAGAPDSIDNFNSF